MKIFRLIETGKRLTVFICLLGLNGCSYFIASATDDLGQNLNQVILNHNDPETIAEAIPSYLLMLETLVKKSPENESLLNSTSSLYSAYLGLLPENQQRQKQLSDKAFQFGLRTACVHRDDFCQLNKLKFDAFEAILLTTEQDDVPALYAVGSAWASWVQTHSQDWNAVAQLAQIKAIMKRIISLDETYKQGSAHIYLGALATFIPPALGGDPEAGKFHFERAIALSEERNLMVKVLYAKQYARMLFDRKLHDALLNEVLKADPVQPELTLINTVAQRQAKDLLNTADDYF